MNSPQPFDVDDALRGAQAVCEQRLSKVQRGRVFRTRAGLPTDGIFAIKEDRAQYILDQLRQARRVVRDEMIPLRESKEAVGFFSLFFAVIGFCAGAFANSDLLQFYIAMVFG